MKCLQHKIKNKTEQKRSRQETEHILRNKLKQRIRKIAKEYEFGTLDHHHKFLAPH